MKLLISTGEVSGDLQGSLLINALKTNAEKRKIELEIIALGGERMKEAGAKLISNTSSIGAIGFLEALPYVLPTLNAQSKIDNYLSSSPPDAVVLIDYMGPNIRLGLKVKKKFPNIPIIYYIAPQEWAWRLGDSGTTDLISFTDKILAIFEEEAKFYLSKGGNVKFVGHPMLDFYRNIPTREESFRRIGLTSDQKLLLIIPASRKQELKYISPVNLLLNKMLIPEFIQEDFKADKIFNAALKILEDNSTKEDIKLGYERLKDKLGKPGVTDRASKDILDLLMQ